MTYVGAALDEMARKAKRTTSAMTLEEAQRHLKTRTEIAFDRANGPGRGGIAWSVMDAHAARLVLYELARLKRQQGAA